MLRPYLRQFPRLAARAFVDDSAHVIGDVEIGEDSSIWPMCVVRGDVNRIRIGARTNVQDGSIIHVTHRSAAQPEGRAALIGDEVTVGHNVILHACTIESGCLIGMGSIVMDDAVLHAGVLLGAGSLVSEGKELEGGYLWMGRPAKRMRPLTDAERALFAYSAAHYVKLKDDYLGRAV